MMQNAHLLSQPSEIFRYAVYPGIEFTFGTAEVPEDRIRDAVLATFDLRPGAIVRDLELLRPIYSDFTVYGHFGRELPNATWERTDRAEALAAAVKG